LYTPQSPQLFAARLTTVFSIGQDTVLFREMAVHHNFGLGFASNLSWFTVPEPYVSDVNVSFLEFRPGSNIDTMGSDGLYVIRPR